jgi:hypothetical protein
MERFMQFDRDAFASAWERLVPTLSGDPVMQLSDWIPSISSIKRTMHAAIEASHSYEELFKQLTGAFQDSRGAYCAMLVMRDLANPALLPDEHLSGDGAIRPDEARIIFGDAIVAESLAWAGGTLVVLGDLHIGGIYVDNFEVRTQLLVGGSVVARGMATFGDIRIRQEAQIAEMVYGLGNDYSLIVGGTLRTRYLVSQYHNIQSGALDAQGTLEEYQDIERLREVMVPELFVAEERNGGTEYTFDYAVMIDRLTIGLPIYR